MQALLHLQRSKSPRGNLVWLRTPVSPILTLDALLSFKPDLFSNESLLLFKLTRAFFTQSYYLEQSQDSMDISVHSSTLGSCQLKTAKDHFCLSPISWGQTSPSFPHAISSAHIIIASLVILLTQSLSASIYAVSCYFLLHKRVDKNPKPWDRDICQTAPHASLSQSPLIQKAE